MGIISLLIGVLAVIVLYLTEEMFLFWLALVNTVLYLVITFAIPNILALTAMKKHIAKVEKMHQQGATAEEIDFILNEEVEITEEDNRSVPTWIYVIGMINVVLSVILLCTGLIIYF